MMIVEVEIKEEGEGFLFPLRSFSLR